MMDSGGCTVGKARWGLGAIMTSFKSAKYFPPRTLASSLRLNTSRNKQLPVLQFSHPSCTVIYHLCQPSRKKLQKLQQTYFPKQLMKYPPMKMLIIPTSGSTTVDERFQITVGNAATIPQITLLSSVDWKEAKNGTKKGQNVGWKREEKWWQKGHERGGGGKKEGKLWQRGSECGNSNMIVTCFGIYQWPFIFIKMTRLLKIVFWF